MKERIHEFLQHQDGRATSEMIASEALGLNDRSYEQRLSAAKMIMSADDPTPTILGILTLSASPRDFLPGDFVQFLRIAGETYSDDIVDDHIVDGNIGAIVTGLEEKFLSHNRIGVDFKSDSQESRTAPYPIVALR